jgi:GDP-L-fucose synthase
VGLPALIRRYEEAARSGVTSVTNWGTGSPQREFLHVDDLARPCLHLLEHYDGPSHVNVGTGTDVTIKELASIVAEAVGYRGSIVWDKSKPDGIPRKLLDISLLSQTDWTASIGLEDGVRETVRWYRQNLASLRRLHGSDVLG